MIGEATNINTLLNNERVYRNEAPQEQQSDTNRAEESREQAASDTTSFSPQALALSRNVVAAGDAGESNGNEAQGRGQESRPAEVGAQFLDIRV